MVNDLHIIFPHLLDPLLRSLSRNLQIRQANELIPHLVPAWASAADIRVDLHFLIHHLRKRGLELIHSLKNLPFSEEGFETEVREECITLC